MERVDKLEELILSLAATFADMETAKRKGYLRRDLTLLRAEADNIFAKRRVEQHQPSSQ